MKDMWNESSQNTNLIISNSLAIFEIVLFIAFKIKMKILNVIYTDCHILALTPPPPASCNTTRPFALPTQDMHLPLQGPCGCWSLSPLHLCLWHSTIFLLSTFTSLIIWGDWNTYPILQMSITLAQRGKEYL